MHLTEFRKPRRVWVNQPSTLQPYHNYHGKKGIAVDNKDNSLGHVTLYFVESETLSMSIDPKALSLAVGEYCTIRNGWIVPVGTNSKLEEVE